VGQLNEHELALRIDAALDSKTQNDLDMVLAGLPKITARPAVAPQEKAQGRTEKLKGFKGNVERSPRTLAPKTEANLYKSNFRYDLRSADWSHSAVEVKINGYKSNVEILVPKGVRVELTGSSYQGSWSDQRDDVRYDGPVLLIRGYVYKGSVTIRDRDNTK